MGKRGREPIAEDPFELATKRLSVSDASPVGRERELSIVRKFVHGEGGYPILQISGAPGTGKTFVVANALESLPIASPPPLVLNGFLLGRRGGLYILLHSHLERVWFGRSSLLSGPRASSKIDK